MSHSSQRILELDALRGLAAVAVVAFHFTTRYDELFGHTAPLAWEAPLGFYGVELFFMLSGFVILMTLDRTPDAWQFAWGRFTRLYPAFWAAVGLTFLVVTLCGLPGQEVGGRDALLNLTMVPALLGAAQVDGAYWSLQAELIFYVSMLVAWRLGFLRYPRLTVSCWLLVATLASLVLVLADNGLLPSAFHQVTKLITLGSLKYIPLFGAGILIYAWRMARIEPTEALQGLSACLLVYGVQNGGQATLVAGGLGCVLALAVSGRLPFLSARPLVYLGALSYPLYLVHQNVGYVVIRFAEQARIDPNLAVLLATAVALLLAVALHHGVEKPALARLRKINPARLLVRPAVPQTEALTA